MKRIVLFILTGFFSVNLISQENSLYDVNYDQPEKSIVFSESELHYQQEYLQYEESLKLLTDEIRNEEKQNQIKAIEKLKKEGKESKSDKLKKHTSFHQ